MSDARQPCERASRPSSFIHYPSSFCVAVALGWSLLALAPVSAQPPQPTLSLIFPAGGQRGKTLQATVYGANLAGASGVRFTGTGVIGSVVKVENPSTVKVSIAISPNAELGERDVRLATPGGISSRFRFIVGDLPETSEVEPNNEIAKAQRLDALPKVINGQLLAEDRDYFRFTAKAGQTLVFAVQGRTLLPYMPDAVPGWIDAYLKLYDAGGRQLRFVNDYFFNPDPLLIYTVEKDGEYVIEITDVLFRGRPEFVYRLTVGVVPYLTRVFPLGGQRKTTAQIELFGANLPAKTLSLPIPADSPPRRLVSVTGGGVSSNALPFAVSDANEFRETEPNDTLAKANRVQVPAAVNGRIQRPGDADYFVFAAKANERLVMEIIARRLQSPLDCYFTVMNAKGDVMADLDDVVDPTDALVTHHADARWVYTFPAAGDYVIRVKDAQGKGGEEYAYRLMITPLKPDFVLRVNPDVARLGRGETIAINVNSIRLDEFGGEISLAVQDLPPGFAASDGVILAGQDQGRLTITAPANPPVTVVAPTIVGTATVGTQTLARQAAGVEAIMQAFSLPEIIPTKEFVFAVLDAPSFTLSTSLPPKQVLQIKQGATAQVVVKAARKDGVKGPINLEANAPPPGVEIKPVVIPADKAEIPVAIAVTKQVPVGLRQFLVLNGTLKTDKETSTRIVPAIAIKVLAP
jgi:hypothetical protein